METLVSAFEFVLKITEKWSDFLKLDIKEDLKNLTEQYYKIMLSSHEPLNL